METNHKSALKPLPRVSANRYKPEIDKHGVTPGFPFTGLGDVVAFVAQPIAKAIDGVAGTNLHTCGGCSQRRESLNQAFPFSRTKQN